MRNFWEQQSFLMDFKFYLQKHSKLANKIASFGKFVSSRFRRFLVGFQSAFWSCFSHSVGERIYKSMSSTEPNLIALYFSYHFPSA